MYFDGVLNALRSDQREQSKIIYRTTMMGQLATEDLDDIRLKYQKMADEVWINMKERERSLEVMRRRCNDIWEYAKSLVRTEVSDLIVRLFFRLKFSQSIRISIFNWSDILGF